MMIRKKRIRNVANYLAGIAVGAELRPVVQLNEGLQKRLSRAGFPSNPKTGDTVLPNAVGPISRFNADGRWNVHRERPKEERYVRTVRWRWKQWAGGGHQEEHEDFRDIYQRCYPRTHIEPPGVELSYVEQGGDAFIVSPVLRNVEGNYEAICHQINLLLELFGECELVKADLNRYTALKVNRLNWNILPPGKHPWPKLHAHLKGCLGRLSENTQSVIFDRQKTILDFEPDEQFIGAGGFSDYIAYVFKDRGIVVLESIRKGNAIYVFGENWAQFSRLSKAEVLNKDLHLTRLIHTKGWKTKFARLVDGREAA